MILQLLQMYKGEYSGVNYLLIECCIPEIRWATLGMPKY